MPDEQDIDQIENEEEDGLFENRDGENVPYDDLDDAEQEYYDSGAGEGKDFVDIDEFSDNYNREAATDWGSGEGGSLTEEDYDSLPIGDVDD